MFGFGVALHFGISGVGAEQQRAVGRKPRDCGEIHSAAVGGRVVDLEIAGVYDRSDGRCNRYAHRVRYGVADAKELDAEAADIERHMRLDHVQARVSQSAALAKLDGD